MGRIPKEIKVGFKHREDTFGGLLGFITSYTSSKKNKIHFEKGFESWADKTIEIQELENEPTSGFVIHERAGGDKCWSRRTEKLRVWDPRGWEFEIGMDAIVHILLHGDIVNGQIQGEFVYGWFGRDGLSLINVNSKEYQSFFGPKETNSPIKNSELVVGQCYRVKNGKAAYYLGKYYTGDFLRDIIHGVNETKVEKANDYFVLKEDVDDLFSNKRRYWFDFKTSYKALFEDGEKLTSEKLNEILWIMSKDFIPDSVGFGDIKSFILSNLAFRKQPQTSSAILPGANIRLGGREQTLDCVAILNSGSFNFYLSKDGNKTYITHTLSHSSLYMGNQFIGYNLITLREFDLTTLKPGTENISDLNEIEQIDLETKYQLEIKNKC